MPLNILLFTPAEPGSTRGNRITIERWAGFLRDASHRVVIADRPIEGDFDCVLAIHATRSHDMIVSFKEKFASRPVVLCLAGTDQHLDIPGHRGKEAQTKANRAIDLADRLIFLEPVSPRKLPEEAQAKGKVIFQSALPCPEQFDRSEDLFEVCVIGHLREVKDPFLTARAVKLLPDSSRVMVWHIGAALKPEMSLLAKNETENNRRYEWLGSVQHGDALKLLARCRLMVLSSKAESAPGVLSESIVSGVPVLATQVDGIVGVLGEDYPGYFSVGDEQALAALIARAETSDSFYQRLDDAVAAMKDKFSLETEAKALVEWVTGSDSTIA